MPRANSTVGVPLERIERSILLVRGQKVMLDFDLAELYRVESRVLNQAVRRNQRRFPPDFMFRLSKQELEDWRSQFVMSNPCRVRRNQANHGPASGGTSPTTHRF